ncbi:MAG: ATP-binding protein [Owenweeksia sp.]|nr:ATP-binding protein [Owenweeksia sp.]
MKSLIKKYQRIIYNNCLGKQPQQQDSVEYWQNRLFANTMAVVIPLSLITTIPGVGFSLYEGLYWLAALDFLSFLLVIYIAFGKGVSLLNRKFLLITVTFVAGIYLLIYLGFKGPGFLFLYSACIFGILILPVKYAFLWSWINLAICGLFSLVLHFDLSPLPAVNAIGIMEWVAISVNLIFLSFLTSFLLPNLFTGLSDSFDKQKELQAELTTEQKKLQQALHDLHLKNQDLEQFAYTASHDLQEPLRMVTGFLGQLKRKYNDQLDDKARQYIRFAEDGSARMSIMINDLLELSRVGRQSGPVQEVSLEKVVKESLEQQKRNIQKTKASVHWKNLPVVNSYPTALGQVMHNLISNALKYTKPDEKPEVIIEATDKGDHWQISVSDNGIGMETAHLEKIFTIFHRLHGTAQYPGTGIGLAIVKKNVELLGGEVCAESEPGRGSFFYFTLPKQKT